MDPQHRGHALVELHVLGRRHLVLVLRRQWPEWHIALFFLALQRHPKGATSDPGRLGVSFLPDPGWQPASRTWRGRLGNPPALHIFGRFLTPPYMR